VKILSNWRTPKSNSTWGFSLSDFCAGGDNHVTTFAVVADVSALSGFYHWEVKIYLCIYSLIWLLYFHLHLAGKKGLHWPRKDKILQILQSLTRTTLFGQACSANAVLVEN